MRYDSGKIKAGLVLLGVAIFVATLFWCDRLATGNLEAKRKLAEFRSLTRRNAEIVDFVEANDGEVVVVEVSPLSGCVVVKGFDGSKMTVEGAGHACVVGETWLVDANLPSGKLKLRERKQ